MGGLTVRAAIKRLTPDQLNMLRAAEAYGSWVLIRTSGTGMDARHFGLQRDALRKLGICLYWNPHYDSLSDFGRKILAALQKASSPTPEQKP